MVLMGVCQHQADQVLAFLFQEADVGHDQVDAGQMLFVAERHPEIDRQPRTLVAVAEAVDRQVHADLADTAKRRKVNSSGRAISLPCGTAREPK